MWLVEGVLRSAIPVTRRLAHAPSTVRCNHGLAVSDFGITEAEETAARLVRPNLSAAQIVGLHAVLQPYGLDERGVGQLLVKWPNLSSLPTEKLRGRLEWLEGQPR